MKYHTTRRCLDCKWVEHITIHGSDMKTAKHNAEVLKDNEPLCEGCRVIRKYKEQK